MVWVSFFSSFSGFGVKIAARCPQVAICKYYDEYYSYYYSDFKVMDEVLRRNAVLPQNRIGETCTEHEVNFVCMCEEFIGLIYYGTSLLFIVIGNYLPKIKQNNTIGIIIVLTLQDEENLNATHSFSGRIWRTSGILCMLCTLHLIKSVSKEACIKAK